MNKALILIIPSLVIGTIGQIFMKGAMLRSMPVTFGTATEIIKGSGQIMQQPLNGVAIPLYATGFFIWAAALSHLQLSFAYPLVAIGYLITPRAAMIA